MNPLSHLSKYNIILGSGSPRRRELFDQYKLPYQVITSDVEEIIPDGYDIYQAPGYLAKLKADALKKSLPGSYLIITADTVVIHRDQILGKPKNVSEAQQMISLLQSDLHTVVTGVTITDRMRQHTFSDATTVSMPSMSKEEISWYIESCEVLDKAGAYGIQDWIGITKISKLEGSYYNVMGLPTHKLYEELRSW